ncbi:protein kinase family protein [Burkholderia ubonensis]|uniref:protein kinase family protein n=1 Tax=Burkholderia ubonensis TaxID=101571 RepID=UPI000A64DD28|nr:protein kinase family protein [Burkholderia ubonensis]
MEEELGRGACGQTVLLFDSTIDERFACKKYSPVRSDMRQQLYDGFVREIKLLHLINHRNVVRLFNYYLFPEKMTGYILMEYVRGSNVEDYLSNSPEDANEIFDQIISGFSHLEENGILHRDIRTNNILVTKDGVVKIIDFGFGKQTLSSDDFDKSVSLNWWCDLPSEFKRSIYDFATEVYFIGKLFEKLLVDLNLQHFKYDTLLGKMCALDPDKRIPTFADVRKTMLSSELDTVDFDTFELKTYREFADDITASLSKIERDAKYLSMPGEVQHRLEDCYKKVMLEEIVPDPSLVLRSLINGGYRYFTSAKISVKRLKDFMNLLRAASREKRNIIIANLQTRLDAIERYKDEMDDDIPF